MNFIKKTNILQILFFSLIVTNSCSKEPKKIAISVPKLSKHNLPTMKPAPSEPLLELDYVAEKKKMIESFYNKNWQNNSLNGSFLVAKNGQIIYEKYEGYADYTKKTLINSDTPLHIASVSKVLTATAVLKLVEANKIELDQKINTILKSFPYPEVTIRTLLNHRSGIPNYSYFTAPKTKNWNRHKMLTNQSILELLETKKINLEFKTNTRFTYSNTNYAILASVIEKITKLSYKEAMDEMIFIPLGMQNTYVFDYENDKEKAVPSYRGNWSKVPFDYLDAVYGDKNIYSTPNDLLKFDRSRSMTDFLPPNLLEQIYKGYSHERQGTKNYGLGIRMINFFTGQNFYFHNGWWHGNTSSYIPLLNENVTIISLSNKFSKSTYRVRLLSGIFGDYPFNFKDED